MPSRSGTSTSLVVQVVDWVAAKRRMVLVAVHLLGHPQQGTQRLGTCRYARSAGPRTRTGPVDRFRVHRPSVHRHPLTAHLRVPPTEGATKHRTLVRPVYIQRVRL